MEAVNKRPQSFQLKQWLSTRKGAYTVAAIAAALGALILIVFINQYKNDVNASIAATPVLTADRVIPRGTAGIEVANERLFKPTAVAQQDLRPGAVTDVSAIASQVAVRTILPGQQITAADFAANADPIRSRISATERAIQIPIDATHGLIGTIRPGDRVDILAAFNSSKVTGASGTPSLAPLIRNVRIMAAPGYSAAVSGSVILQVTDRQAAALAFASDNAKLWFLLRPPVGSRDSRDVSVSEQSLVAAGKAVEVTSLGNSRIRAGSK